MEPNFTAIVMLKIRVYIVSVRYKTKNDLSFKREIAMAKMKELCYISNSWFLSFVRFTLLLCRAKHCTKRRVLMIVAGP